MYFAKALGICKSSLSGHANRYICFICYKIQWIFHVSLYEANNGKDQHSISTTVQTVF